MKKLIVFLMVNFIVWCAAGQVFSAEKGTAAEAEAMVKKAIEFYKANGKEKTFTEINNAQGQFVKGDLYVFVWDFNGLTLAHGANAKLIGKTVIGLKDPEGKLFVAESVELAKTKGTGWVDYKWTNPATQKMEAKSTYVEKVDDIIFCCGIYK